MRWSCNCILCRLVVHPVVRRFESVGSVGLGNEVSPQKPEEVTEDLIPKQQGLEVKALEIPQQIQQPQQDLTQVKQVEVVGEVRIPKEVIERFEQIEEEIGKLRKELSTLSESMKTVLIEVKEAISEVSNPFNVLRERSDGSKDGNGSRRDGRKIQPSTFLNLLKVAYKMLDEIGKEETVLILKGYADVGVVDEHVGEVLIKLVELADAMKSKGLTVEKQIPYIYSLLKTLNVSDPALDEYLLKELLRRERLG